MLSKFNAQDIASYAAVIVACVALYVGWDQARVGRNQQHADVFPVLQIDTTFLTHASDSGQEQRHVRLTITNEGVGPAFVENSVWQIANNPITHPSEIKNGFPQGLTLLSEYQGQQSNFLLGAGEETVLWEAFFPTEPEDNKLLSQYMQSFWEMKLERVDICGIHLQQFVDHFNNA